MLTFEVRRHSARPDWKKGFILLADKLDKGKHTYHWLPDQPYQPGQWGYVGGETRSTIDLRAVKGVATLSGIKVRRL